MPNLGFSFKTQIEHTFEMEMTVMYLYSDLEDFVRKLYYFLKISKAYQIDKFLIAEKLNVSIRYFDETSEAISINNKNYIFLNKSLSRPQRWQVFAHELCHILRHSGYQYNMPLLFRELQEWQADCFMYHFCVPTFMLKEMELPLRINEATWFVAETFNVEIEFARKRLNMWINKRQSFLLQKRVAESVTLYERSR